MYTRPTWKECFRAPSKNELHKSEKTPAPPLKRRLRELVYRLFYFSTEFRPWPSGNLSAPPQVPWRQTPLTCSSPSMDPYPGQGQSSPDYPPCSFHCNESGRQSQHDPSH